MHYSRAHIWFVGPAVLLMFIILIFPILLAGGISFTNYNLGNSSFDWIGLENYEKMFSRKTYIKMIWATATYVLIVVPFSVVIGLCAAMLLNSLRFGADVYKTIFFLPVMATLLAMAIAWEFTLHPTMGIVNSFLANGCGGIREFILGYETELNRQHIRVVLHRFFEINLEIFWEKILNKIEKYFDLIMEFLTFVG